MPWKLSEGGFQLVPKGTHIFKITDVEWDEDFGKLKVTMETANGYKHIEHFSLLDADGEVNEKANNAYSYFVRTALNNPSLDEIEHESLVGCYIEAEVEHEDVPDKKDPAKTKTFARLGKKSAATGFANGTTKGTAVSAKSSAPKTNKRVNLDDLLG